MLFLALIWDSQFSTLIPPGNLSPGNIDELMITFSPLKRTLAKEV